MHVAHFLLCHTLFLTFRGLLGLESRYRSRSKEEWWGGSWGQSASSCGAAASGEAIKVSPGIAGSAPLDEGGKADTTMDEDSSEKAVSGLETSLPLTKKTHRILGA